MSVNFYILVRAIFIFWYFYRFRYFGVCQFLYFGIFTDFGILVLANFYILVFTNSRILVFYQFLYFGILPITVFRYFTNFCSLVFTNFCILVFTNFFILAFTNFSALYIVSCLVNPNIIAESDQNNPLCYKIIITHLARDYIH